MAGLLTLNDRDFERIVRFVRENYGIELGKKRALIQGRMGLDIERRGFASFTQYLDAVLARPAGLECQHMIDKLSTNHTFFFREPGCFTHMRDVAVPALVRAGATRIDVWCAAVSTGQECYAAAMTLDEALAPYPRATYRILGSDVNTEVLAVARRGVYDAAQLEAIPKRYHSRYLRVREDGSFEIAERLREHIEWRRVNLVRSLAAIPQQHLVLCRNVMIYFAPDTKDALCAELHRITRDGGYVYVGSTETLDMKRMRFRYVEPSVFAKKVCAP